MSNFTDYEKHHIHEFVYKTTDIDSKIDESKTESIYCLFYKEVDDRRIMFGCFINQWLVPSTIKIKYISLHILSTENNSAYEAISMILNNTIIHSTTATQDRIFEWDSNDNTVFLKNDLIHCKLLKLLAQPTNIEKAFLNVVYHKID